MECGNFRSMNTKAGLIADIIAFIMDLIEHADKRYNEIWNDRQWKWNKFL